MADINGHEINGHQSEQPSQVADDLEADVELAKVASELESVDRQIAELQEWRRLLVNKQELLLQQLARSQASRLASHDWEMGHFAWSERLATLLRVPFGIASGFRPLQRSAINASMSGHDVLLVMPTGGGKSLCFQLPAQTADGITLVVTPLVSLMEDQVLSLRRRGLAAEFINAGCPPREVSRVQAAMTDPASDLRLLYVTPEKLAKSKRFMTKLQKMHKMKRFARLAIDEVHCCSQWGHDFRPDYKFLGVMKNQFPDVPIMGLTATCTPGVTTDLMKILNIPRALVFRAPFNRPNLSYEVRSKPASANECVQELVDLIKGKYRGQSGIVYTTTIRDTEDVAQRLEAAGVAAAPYHASLEPAQRSKVHERWIANRVQVIVATIAFGMGIDKPDVRFVIHHSLSKSLENYYQESGRAGRDGLPADCLLLFRLQDVFSLSTMVWTDAVAGLKNLYAMLRYCLNATRCRRRPISEHFEESWTEADCARQCDVCRTAPAARQEDVTGHARALQEVVTRAASAEERVTASKLLDAWLGRGPARLRLESLSVPTITRERAETIVAHLLVNRYLKEDFHVTAYKTISYMAVGRSADRGPVLMEVAGPPEPALRRPAESAKRAAVAAAGTAAKRRPTGPQEGAAGRSAASIAVVRDSAPAAASPAGRVAPVGGAAGDSRPPVQPSLVVLD